MNKYNVKIDESILPESYTFDELIENGLLDEIDNHIQIKLTEEDDWVIARYYPFANTETPINNILENKRMSGFYTLNEDGTINRPGNFNKPPKPDTNLIWSVICLSICLPFGIMALIESIKVDSLYSDGDYDGAQEASEKSKKWSMWCLWAWLLLFAIVIIAAIANS